MKQIKIRSNAKTPKLEVTRLVKMGREILKWGRGGRGRGGGQPPTRADSTVEVGGLEEISKESGLSHHLVKVFRGLTAIRSSLRPGLRPQKVAFS